MKRLVFIFISAGIAFIGICQQSANQFRLNGTIKGQNDGYLYLSYPLEDGTMKRDSAKIINSKFRFTGELPQSTIASLSGKTVSRSVSDPNFTMFFLEPASMSISVVANEFKKATIKGSRWQDEYALLNKSKQAIEDKYSRQLDSLRTERDHEKNAAIRERLAPYFDEQNQADYQFIQTHPHSLVSAYMMRFHVDDLPLDSLETYYNHLGELVQQTSYGKEIAAEIDKLKAGSPGHLAKDFTTTDIEGQTLNLSAFRGKYVLIDFWASWCVPCRKGNPHLKEIYSKYHDKGFEIIGIADDDRAEQAWKTAVEKDGIGIWKHVRRGLKYANGNFDRSSDISENFGIHTLPTRILIDPQGMIIGRYGEQEADLDKKLVQLFAN